MVIMHLGNLLIYIFSPDTSSLTFFKVCNAI
jgi:hypothetical protein